jgi:ADP-sugar diphosphatase
MAITDEPKLLAWCNDVKSAGCTIKSVETLLEIRKKNGKLLFSLLDANVRSPEGDALPHIIFIRGHACIIVPLLKNRNTGEERFLMIRQRRIGNGQLSLEFPAGMLDDLTDAADVAVRELEEETGLILKKDEIIPLYDGKLYSSVGASDEAIYYFCCIKELGDAEFNSFRGRSGGNPEENERISVTLMQRLEAEQEATSLQVRLGFYLFEDYLKKCRASS